MSIIHGFGPKIPKISVDGTPTQGSQNPVSSGGVYDALQNIDISKITPKESTMNLYGYSHDNPPPSGKTYQEYSTDAILSQISTLLSNMNTAIAGKQPAGNYLTAAALNSYAKTFVTSGTTYINVSGTISYSFSVVVPFCPLLLMLTFNSNSTDISNGKPITYIHKLNDNYDRIDNVKDNSTSIYYSGSRIYYSYSSSGTSYWSATAAYRLAGIVDASS